MDTSLILTDEDALQVLDSAAQLEEEFRNNTVFLESVGGRVVSERATSLGETVKSAEMHRMWQSWMIQAVTVVPSQPQIHLHEGCRHAA